MSRKQRRRRERERARHTAARPQRSWAVRGGALLVGALLILAGVGLLVASSQSKSAERLGRFAGVLMLVGLALIAAAALNWL